MSRLPHCEGYESVYCAPGVCFAPWQRSALPKLSPMHHEKLDMIRSPTNNDEVEAGLKPAKGASPPCFIGPPYLRYLACDLVPWLSYGI
jgi:hypothetical protein